MLACWNLTWDSNHVARTLPRLAKFDGQKAFYSDVTFSRQMEFVCEDEPGSQDL